MATVIRNPLGEALQRTSENILNLSVRESQFRRNLELQRDELGVRRQQVAGALISTLAPFARRDTPIADQPLFHPMLQELIPDIDPADVASPIGSLVPRESNLQDFAAEFARNNQEFVQQFLPDAIAKELIGLTTGESNLQNLRLAVMQESVRNNIQALSSPDTQRRIAFDVFGTEPHEAIRIGDIETDIPASQVASFAQRMLEFQTETRLRETGLRLTRRGQDFSMFQFNEQMVQRMSEGMQEQAKQLGISLGRGPSQQVAELVKARDFEKLGELAQSTDSEGNPTPTAWAAQMALGATQIMDETENSILMLLPEQERNSILLRGALEEAGMDDETANNFMIDILERQDALSERLSTPGRPVQSPFGTTRGTGPLGIGAAIGSRRVEFSTEEGDVEAVAEEFTEPAPTLADRFESGDVNLDQIIGSMASQFRSGEQSLPAVADAIRKLHRDVPEAFGDRTTTQVVQEIRRRAGQ